MLQGAGRGTCARYGPGRWQASIPGRPIRTTSRPTERRPVSLRAIETLEAVVRDRGLLGALSVEERTRLLSAAGEVYNPDLETRRRGTKAASAAGEGGSARPRRAGPGRDRAAGAARQARLHDAERRAAGRARPGGGRRGEPGAPRGDRAAALLRLQAALRRGAPVLRPALRRRAATSTSRSAARSPTSADASLCSPAGA